MYRTSFRITGAGLSLRPQLRTAAAKTRFPMPIMQPVMKYELQSSPRRSSSVCSSLSTPVIVGSHWSRQVFNSASVNKCKAQLYSLISTYSMCR
jgi:hypothetical protein